MLQRMIRKLVGQGWDTVRQATKVGSVLTRVVQSEVGQVLEQQDSTVLAGLGKMLRPGAPSAASSQPLTSRLTRQVLHQVKLGEPTGREVARFLEEIESGKVSPKNSREFRQQLQERLKGEVEVETIHRDSPNFFPSLLANARSAPPLKAKGKLNVDLSDLKAGQIAYRQQKGRVFAEVTTSLEQLAGSNSRTRQIAEDYASDDMSLKLRIPLGSGQASDFESLSLAAQKQLLKSGLHGASECTVLMHGFQSAKDIWDSTAHHWAAPDSISLAVDGFGTDGKARSDGTAAYTPKQYAFQVLESLDALGLLGGKDLKVVGHSMGGGAAAEMAVALDKVDYAGRANFVLLAPACFPDHLPLFSPHRSLMDVVNAALIGGIYLPLGALELTAPLVQWADEKVPIVSKMVIDHGLGLNDTPQRIRDHNADYYRTPNTEVNQRRRERSLEAMLGLATQQGVDPSVLQSAGKRFGVFVANFGLDRLVDPQAVRRLEGPGVGYLEVPPGSHNAVFSAKVAQRVSQASQRFFEEADPSSSRG